MQKLKPSYFRNIIFGAEDSLVSTVGVLFGVATALNSKEAIIMTGLVVIAVEALSMGAGAYLSEAETQEVHKSKEGIPVIDGLLMFGSYFLAGFIPLAPYIFVEATSARYLSVVFTMISLFVLGYIPQKSVKAAVRMGVVAGIAVLIGFIIASVFKVGVV